MPHGWTDWIDLYMDYTEGLPTSRLFRLWSALVAIGGSVERRVWVRTGRRELFPNLFVMLVSPPGIGKDTAIRPATQLLRDTRNVKMAPDSMTSAAMLDAFTSAKKNIVLDGKIAFEYTSLFISTPEFGVLMSKYEPDLLFRLNKIFDHELQLEVQRQFMGDTPKRLVQPIASILAGTQPAYLGSTIPEEGWNTGFLSRMIFIYSQTAPYIDPFDEGRAEAERPQLLSQLKHLSSNHFNGKIEWAPESIELARLWFASGMDPAPRALRLEHYNTRRRLHFIKLCMISSLSRCGEVSLILPSDINRARDWLLEAEKSMPEMFRTIAGRTDHGLLNELSIFVFSLYHKNGRKAVDESNVISFLAQRTPADRIPRLLEVAIQAKMLTVTVGTSSPDRTFIPSAPLEKGPIE